MYFEIAPLYVRGKRISQKEARHVERIRGDVQICQVPSSPLGRQSLCAHIFKSAPSLPDLLPPLYEARISGMATLAFAIEGFEEVDGQIYLQEWHCRLPDDQFVAPWTACPRSTLDQLI